MKVMYVSTILGLLMIMQTGCEKNLQSMSNSEVTINDSVSCKLEIRNESFDEVLKFLKGKITIPISIGNNVDTVRKITGTFQDNSWDLILEKICAQLDYRLVKELDKAGKIIRIKVLHNQPDAGDSK